MSRVISRKKPLRTRYTPLCSFPRQVPDGDSFISLALEWGPCVGQGPAGEKWHRQKGNWGEFNEGSVHKGLGSLSRNQRRMVKHLKPALLPPSLKRQGREELPGFGESCSCRRASSRTVAFCREMQPCQPTRRPLEEWIPDLTSSGSSHWPTHVVSNIGFTSI